MTQTHLSDVDFSQLELSKEVLEGVANAGFVKCTPIQAQTLPMAIRGLDVAGQAQTGTGKSAAFLLAMFHRLLNTAPDADRTEKDTRAFILAPTRELAIQIFNDAQTLGKHLGFKTRLIYGGTDYEKQRRSLEDGVDIIIGTPGRVIDYYKQGLFTLKHVQVVVLDEADRMFDLGFIKDIRYLLRRLPPPERRQNMLFSATLSQRVLELAYEHMNDPELVRIEPEKVTADRVTQIIYFPANKEKLPLLISLLRSKDPSRTMVFVNTKRAAETVQRYLAFNGFSVEAISGDVPQNKRQRMLGDFQRGELQILVGTDVASRGLHVPDVSHVFNYDLPQDGEDYTHRIGRTARAGAAGNAISFGCEDYAMSLPDIETYIGRRIPVGRFDHDELPEIKHPPRPPRRPRDDRRGGRGGGRPGGRSSGRGGGRPGGRSGARSGSGSSSSSSGKSGGGGGASGTAPSDGNAPAKKKRRRSSRRKPATPDSTS